MKKRNVSNDKIFYTILSLISLCILLKIYDYLNKLEDCDCYNDVIAYNNLKINIDLLKAYQIFEMFLVVIFVVILFCGSSMKSNKKGVSLTFLSTSVILLLAFVTGYISYNVFLVYSISNTKCECVDKWQKYFLYVQGIMNSVVFLRIFFLMLFVFLLLLSNYLLHL